MSILKSMSLPVFVGAVLMGVARRGEAATVTVTTPFVDVVNGDTSSIPALIASDGGDGISLREAIRRRTTRPAPTRSISICLHRHHPSFCIRKPPSLTR